MNALIHGFGPRFALPITPAPHPSEEEPHPTRELGFATIELTPSLSAQGPVTRRFRDGRVTINTGEGLITGHPIGGTAPRGWWASLVRSG